MKVMLRMIMRFVPGKLMEGRKLLDKFLAIIDKKHGIPATSVRKYSPWLGGGDAMHTIIMEFEIDSLTKMAEFFEKTWADPEVMQTMSQWDGVEESHRVELYMVMQ